MRAILLIFAVAGCSTVGEFNQRIEERASAVVYAVTETAVPDRPRLRPVARPTAVITAPVTVTNPLRIARQYLGYTEILDRTELREFLGVDPMQTEWCAAFVNSVLHSVGQPGSETVSAHPLLARGFVNWGEPVDHKREEPRAGDVVVFPRGRQSWQGHVGFYVDTVTIDGKDYWQILGGNQNNSVSIELYDPSRAIAVRRAPRPVVTAHSWIDRVISWFA
jgi:uncharacterized protein (TIGR02594 family)